MLSLQNIKAITSFSRQVALSEA